MSVFFRGLLVFVAEGHYLAHAHSEIVFPEVCSSDVSALGSCFLVLVPSRRYSLRRPHVCILHLHRAPHAGACGQGLLDLGAWIWGLAHSQVSCF